MAARGWETSMDADAGSTLLSSLLLLLMSSGIASSSSSFCSLDQTTEADACSVSKVPGDNPVPR